MWPQADKSAVCWNSCSLQASSKWTYLAAQELSKANRQTCGSGARCFVNTCDGGVVKEGERWGAQLRLFSQKKKKKPSLRLLHPHRPSPSHLKCLWPRTPTLTNPPQPPPPLVSCQSPNLKGAHFTEGEAEVMGQRLTAALWAEANFDDESRWRSTGRGGQREPGGVAGSSSLTHINAAVKLR